jgi:hypothetical protein
VLLAVFDLRAARTEAAGARRLPRHAVEHRELVELAQVVGGDDSFVHQDRQGPWRIR